MRNREEELAKHSKKLTAISFAIIVFVSGGGQFNEQPEYFSGLIRFDYIHVIPITVFIVFLFYWYRFWVWQRKPIQYSKSYFYNSLKKDTKFKSYFHDKSKEEIKYRIDNSIHIGDKIWSEDEQNRPIEAKYDPGIHKQLGFFTKRFKVNSVDGGGRKRGKIEVKLDWKRYFHILRVKIRSNFYNQEYTYRVLPFWMAMLALFCMIQALITGKVIV